MIKELVLNEEMKEQMLTLTLDQFFTRVTTFMDKSGAEEAEFNVTGDYYECELHFKQLEKQTNP